MADIADRLWAMFEGHKDPAMRHRAGQALAKRGDPRWRQAMEGRIAETQKRSAQLQQEQIFERSEGYGDMGNQMADYLKASGATASDLASLNPDAYQEAQDTGAGLAASAAEGIQDPIDWITAGNYRKARDKILPGSSGMAEVEKYPFAHGLGRAAALVGTGAATAGPAATTALETAGATMMTDAPMSLGRRLSEGEESEDALAGAAWDALKSGVVSGALAKVGSGRGARRRRLEEREAGKPARQARADRGVAEDEPIAATVADEHFQRLKSANAARLKKVGAEYDGLADQFLENATDVDVDRFRQNIFNARRANVLENGEVLDTNLDKALEKIERWTTPAKMGGKMSVDGIMKARAQAQKLANFDGASRDATDKAWGEAYRELNGAIDAMDTTGKFAQARGIYRSQLDHERAINDKLTGRDAVRLDDAAGNPMTEANRLRRMATARGGGAAREADELAQMDPDVARAIEDIRIADQGDALAKQSVRAETALDDQIQSMSMYRRAKTLAADKVLRGQRIDPRVTRGAGLSAGPTDLYSTEDLDEAMTSAKNTAQGAYQSMASSNPAQSQTPQAAPVPVLQSAARTARDDEKDLAQKLTRRRKGRPPRNRYETVDPITGEVIQ